jgi:molybdopterin synthase sulfur carrier subunit
MRVRIPTPLRSYTNQRAEVTAEGSTLDELFTDLDRRFPGLRFRVIDEQGQLRPHMSVFLGDERCRDLATSLEEFDEVVIMQALSGG